MNFENAKRFGKTKALRVLKFFHKSFYLRRAEDQKLHSESFHVTPEAMYEEANNARHPNIFHVSIIFHFLLLLFWLGERAYHNDG